MPLVREFRGRLVKRTRRRRGGAILVTFESAVPGRPGDRVVVPLTEFLRQRSARFQPSANTR